MLQVSAVIITYNEEKSIARCIDSLKPVAEEIIVLDSFSTDKTEQICRSKGVKFFQTIFEGHIEQKNKALELASNNYVLSLDADEYLSEELCNSILEIKKSGSSLAYSMNRLSSLKGRWIYATNWYPDKKIRLWDKRVGKWGGYNPHDHVVLNKNVKIKHLRGELFHEAYDSVDALFKKAIVYGELYAKGNYAKVSCNAFTIFYKTLFAFIKSYFLKAGIFYGFDGLAISFSISTYTFYKYSKLFELNRSLPFFKEQSNSDSISGISIVIPNYNGENLFPKTLPSLFEVMEETKLPYEVIIVDDCSSDNSVSFLTANFPSIKILTNETNKGFSVSCNKGIKEAQFDLLFLLNSDIILTKGYFDHQLKYFSDKTTFGVMGRIVGWDDEIVQDGAKLPEFHSNKIKTSSNYLLKSMHEESLYTFYLSGANALVDRKKILELGGFDELFSPFYIEDCDLSFRAWRIGWKCYFENRAICRHKTSTSVKAKNAKKYVDIIYNRNKLFLHAIHLNKLKLPLWFVQVFLELVVRTVTLRLSYFHSFLMFLKNLDKIIQSRKRFEAIQQAKSSNFSIHRISKTIKESLYKRKKIKFYSSEKSVTV